MNHSREDTLLFDDKFLATLGAFYGAWSDLDYAIGEFLELSAEQTHLLTTGMMFGRKAALLAALLDRSSHPKRTVLRTALNVVWGEIGRDSLAHAYLTATPTTVRFIHRKGGEYRVKEREFNLLQFLELVEKLAKAGADLQTALGFDFEKQKEFVQAAYSAAKKG